MAERFYKFAVKGTGMFPIDMLRYDCCWPYQSGDAANVADKLSIETMAQNHDWIQMCGIKEPTVARWNSFSWSVERM